MEENQIMSGAIVTKLAPALDYTVGKAGIPVKWTYGFDVETLLPNKIPVKNQETSYSCGGQAVSYYKAVLASLRTGKFDDKSAKFIYSHCFVPSGGSSVYGLGNTITKRGDSSESLCHSTPSTEANLTRTSGITKEAYTDALNNLSESYAQLTSWDIDSIAEAIRDHNGCILGIYGQNNGTWLTAYPQPPVGTDNRWAHWVYAGKFKLINGKKYIGILNSWGNIGDNGWQWLSEDFFPKIFCAWVATDKQNVVVPTFKYHWTHTMRKGDSGTDIKALQKALKLDNCFPQNQSITGFFGDITFQSVKLFQEKYGSEILSPQGLAHATGFVGNATLKKLNELYA